EDPAADGLSSPYVLPGKRWDPAQPSGPRARSHRDARATAARPANAPGQTPQASAAASPAYSATPPARIGAMSRAAGTSRARRNSNRSTSAITGATISRHSATQPARPNQKPGSPGTP